MAENETGPLTTHALRHIVGVLYKPNEEGSEQKEQAARHETEDRLGTVNVFDHRSADDTVYYLRKSNEEIKLQL